MVERDRNGQNPGNRKSVIMVQKRELVDLAIKQVHFIIFLGDGQAKFW